MAEALDLSLAGCAKVAQQRAGGLACPAIPGWFGIVIGPFDQVSRLVDESGVLKGFSRMDGAAQLSVDIAQDKAYTAISFSMPTHAWFDFIKNDPPLLHGIVKTPRLVVFGGGYPVEIDGKIVGGIGVSGGHYSQDMKVAEAALAALKG